MGGREEEEAGRREREMARMVFGWKCCCCSLLWSLSCVLGKLPQCRLCSVQNSVCSEAGHSLIPFSKVWESTIMFTSLSSVALSGNHPQKECFRLLIFLHFLGSEKYLLPQFLTLLGSQVRMSFILASVEDRNGIIIEDNFQKKTKFLSLVSLFLPFEHTL